MYTFLRDEDRFKIRCMVSSTQCERNVGRLVVNKYFFPTNLVFDLFKIKGIKPIPEICGMLDRPNAIQQIMSYGMSIKEQTVLSAIYAQCLSVKDVGMSLGISSSQVSLIRDNALNKIWVQLM